MHVLYMHVCMCVGLGPDSRQNDVYTHLLTKMMIIYCF